MKKSYSILTGTTNFFHHMLLYLLMSACFIVGVVIALSACFLLDGEEDTSGMVSTLVAIFTFSIPLMLIVFFLSGHNLFEKSAASLNGGNYIRSLPNGMRTYILARRYEQILVYASMLAVIILVFLLSFAVKDPEFDVGKFPCFVLLMMTAFGAFVPLSAIKNKVLIIIESIGIIALLIVTVVLLMTDTVPTLVLTIVCAVMFAAAVVLGNMYYTYKIKRRWYDD